VLGHLCSSHPGSRRRYSCDVDTAVEAVCFEPRKSSRVVGGERRGDSITIGVVMPRMIMFLDAVDDPQVAVRFGDRLS
jgi:hypothetical protein